MNNNENHTPSFWWKDGFYDYPIEGGVEITQEYWEQLLDGQSSDKQIATDDDGRPILIDPPGPTPAELRSAEIAGLKAKLASTDWIMAKCYELKLSAEDEYPDECARRALWRARIDELETA